MQRREFLGTVAGIAGGAVLANSGTTVTAEAAQAAQAGDAELTQTIQSLGFDSRSYVDAGGKVLPYLLALPKGYDPAKEYPLVLFLHGAGERGRDNRAQLKHKSGAVWATDAVQSKNPCFMVAPQCPETDKWTGVEKWDTPVYRQPEAPTEALRLVMELLPSLRKQYRVGALYATGLSMGGYGTWELLNRRPDWWTAAAPICGGADETLAERVRVPVWAFHGGADTVVLPVQSRRMTDTLKKLGREVRYTEYEGVGHNSWDKAYSEPTLPDWLFSHKKA